MKEMGACGIICKGCDIMLAPENPELAKSISEWMANEHNVIVKPEDVQCQGCLGPRDKHWGFDCWILLCCVDGKGLDNCSQCKEFPCRKLEEWATQNDRYAAALERLGEMKN